ncbi:hypothetical protein FACS1894190_12600 [Spirochaetia bacterium]|nr:hypothetical protein FACS1894190_12600 [Spirochaetia bacterium]
MFDTALLLKEIEGVPDQYKGEILDFVGYLKHKAHPEICKKPPLSKTMEKIWELCKDSKITVDSFLEERHAENEREEEKFRRMFHHECE